MRPREWRIARALPWLRSRGFAPGLVLVTAMLLAMVVALQILSGAYTASFDFDADSHYISGLMIHDYLTAVSRQSPLAFLQTFHSHYPLVGIGHWGPVYYLIEAAWMLLLSTSRGSVLMLSAAVTAVTATMLYALIARRCGRMCGFIVAGLFAACPIVQESSDAVMLDGIITLLCLTAALVYARYLGSGRILDAILFGSLAAAALLVKGNAACLVLMPPFAVLIGRRFDLLRSVSFWLPIPIVGLLAGPWYLLTYSQVSQGFRYRWGVDYFGLASKTNLRFLLAGIGPIALAFAMLGLVSVVVHRTTRRDHGLVVAAALLAAVWVFQSIVPSGLEDRYLIPLAVC
jgi:4-amino-4-deoxy-L-arabinose transferase-like glycosyltransferase